MSKWTTIVLGYCPRCQRFGSMRVLRRPKPGALPEGVCLECEKAKS